MKQWQRWTVRAGIIALVAGASAACATAGDESSGESLGVDTEHAYWDKGVRQWFDATPQNTLNVCFSGYFDWDNTQPQSEIGTFGTAPCASDSQCDASKAQFCQCKPGTSATCGNREVDCARDSSQCACQTGLRGKWSTTTTTVPNARAWIRDAIVAEWGNAADLHITFSDTCPNPIPSNYVPLRLAEVSGFGGIAGYAVGGVGARAGQEPFYQGVDPEAQLNFSAFEGDPLSQQQIKATAVHEMGHVLALLHEHERPDRLDNSCVHDLYVNQDGGMLTEYDADSIMSYCRDINRDGTADGYTSAISPVLTPLDRMGAQALYGFPRPFAQPGRNFCNGTYDRPFAGRFNADTRADVLCLNVQSGQMSVDLADTTGKLSSVDWTAPRNFCINLQDRLFVGDTNGDGRDDLVCNNLTTGLVTVSLATSTGTFPTTDYTGPAGFCSGPPGSMFVADVTGDKRADIVCRRDDGTIEVDIADSAGHYGRIDATVTLPDFCQYSTQSLLAGDVTGDGKADLVCYDRSNAQVSVLPSTYAGSGAVFTRTGPAGSPERFPTGCSLSTLALADLNGDGRKDILCRSGGMLSASFANTTGGFAKADFQGPFAKWCSNTLTDKLFTGPFAGGSRDDLLCISQNGNEGQQFSSVPSYSLRCNETNSIDLGAPGTVRTVSNNACLMVKTGYPSWWGNSRVLKLQDPVRGPSPVPFVWSNTCSESSGSGVFNANWDDKLFSTTSSSCPTFIDLQGPGNGTMQVNYYGQ